jgi:hypothetical protein
MEENGKQVELSGTREIELPQIDISKYIGKKTKIEKVTEHEGNFGYFVKVESEVVDTLEVKDKEGNPIQLRASRIFGLQEDAAGQVGWGAKTKLGVFLKKMGVAHYNDLKGKEVIVQSTLSKEDGKEYLSF